MSKSDLKKLFLFCTSQTHFLFQGNYYDQIDGVAIGSPLAPLLTNLFMGFHEKNWMEHYQGSPPVLYRRYVDDIFAAFNSESEAKSFFDYINTRHTNIKFTMETEVNGIISFLDVRINNNSEYSLPQVCFTNLLTLVYFSTIIVSHLVFTKQV